MKSINIQNATATFELNGTTYTYHIETRRYSKTTNGKTTRIGKAEYEAAEQSAKEFAAIEDPNVSVEEFAKMIGAEVVDAEAAQAELDKEPCRVEVENDLYKPAVMNEFGCVDCSECKVEVCVHRDCMRRNPKTVGGLGECPRLDVKPQPEYADPNDPENAYPDEAQDPELEQIKEEIPGIENAEAELERNIRKEKKAKKAAKPRRSKDVGFEYKENGETIVTLTAKQVDFILHIADTDFWDGFDNGIFVDVLCDQIGGQFEGKPMTVGAMISTLCEKGLGGRARDTSRQGKPIVFGFTALGIKVAMAVGLK